MALSCRSEQVSIKRPSTSAALAALWPRKGLRPQTSSTHSWAVSFSNMKS